MKNPNELKDLLSELEEKGSSYFVDFITTKGIQAGIIRLHLNEKDTQEPHSYPFLHRSRIPQLPKDFV